MTDPMEKPVMMHPADGFFVRNQIDNTAWIDMGGFAIIIDTLEQPELKDEIFTLLDETIEDLPIKYIINTHTHYDHVALNDALVQKYGAKIINSATVKIGSDGYKIEGTKRTLELYHFPGCHTDEDVAAWLPEDRALFAGDIFGWGIIPLCVNMRDKQIKTLLDTYGRLVGFDPALVIPGHGPLATKDDLIRWVEYFKWLIGEISVRVAQGQSDDKIQQEVTIPPDMQNWWRLAKWKHEDNINRVIKSVSKFNLTLP